MFDDEVSSFFSFRHFSGCTNPASGVVVVVAAAMALAAAAAVCGCVAAVVVVDEYVARDADWCVVNLDNVRKHSSGAAAKARSPSGCI